MHGTLLKLIAKPGMREQLLEFLRWDAAVAQAAEPGTLRFDVWDVPKRPDAPDEPDAVYLYEGYIDSKAFARHKSNAPYRRFIEEIEPHILDEKNAMFDGADSLISNVDPIWRDGPVGSAISPIVRPGSSPEISRLSVGSFPPDPEAVSHFNGYAELRHLTPNRNASVAHVHFPPGVWTRWHRHSGEQVLWFVEGEGQVSVRDGSSVSCRTGDIVRVEAGSRHWHGASTNRHATHIAITLGDTQWEEDIPVPPI